MKSFSDTLYRASKEGYKFREPSNAIQARKLMSHIEAMRLEIVRWEKKNKRANPRKRKALAETVFRFFLKYELAYGANPKGLDDLERFADSLKGA